MKRLFLTFCLLSAALFGAAQDRDSVIQALDNYIEQVREQWAVPGMSVAVIQGGETLLAKGYGVKEKGGEEPVDEQTVFQIGSVSKSFTSALMAMMVEEGKLKWKDRVKDILPDFNPVDPIIREDTRVADLMTHRMGYTSQAATYFPNLGYDRAQTVKMLYRLQPEYGLRDGKHYNNMTFLIASQILEQVSGRTWEELIQERLFTPLGMTSASTGKDGYLSSPNVAGQHELSNRGDTLRVVQLRGENRALEWLTVIGPAGGVNANVCDLARWAEFHRTGGLNAQGERILSEEQMKYLHRGVAVDEQKDDYVTLYGQCWYIEQSRKCRIYYHTGTTWGHTALCVFIPEFEMSLAILVNSEAPGGVRFSIMRRLIDLWLGLPDTDYSTEAFEKWLVRKGSAPKKASRFALRKERPAASALCGSYAADSVLGNARIWMKDNRLYIKIGPKGWVHRMVHERGNRWAFDSDGHRFRATFDIGPDGTARAFDLDWGHGETFDPWVRRN